MINKVKISVSFLMILSIDAHITQVVTKDQDGDPLSQVYLLDMHQSLFSDDRTLKFVSSKNNFDEKETLSEKIEKLSSKPEEIQTDGYKIFKIGAPLVKNDNTLFPAVVRKSGIMGWFGRTDIAEIKIDDKNKAKVEIVSEFGHHVAVHKIAYLRFQKKGNARGFEVIVSGSRAPTIKFASSDTEFGFDKIEWKDCYLLDVVLDTVYFLKKHRTLKKWYVDFKKITTVDCIKKQPDDKIELQVQSQLCWIPRSEKKTYELKEGNQITIDSTNPGKIKFTLNDNNREKALEVIEWTNCDLFFASAEYEGSEHLVKDGLYCLLFKKYDRNYPDFRLNFSWTDFQNKQDLYGAIEEMEVKAQKKILRLSEIDQVRWQEISKTENENLQKLKKIVNSDIGPSLEKWSQGEWEDRSGSEHLFSQLSEIGFFDKLDLNLARVQKIKLQKSYLQSSLRSYLKEQEEKVEMYEKEQKQAINDLKKESTADFERNLKYVEGELVRLVKINKLVIFDPKNAPIVSIDKQISSEAVVSMLQAYFNSHSNKKEYLFLERNTIDSTYALKTKDSV